MTSALMEYLPSKPPPSRQGADKYMGATAAGYDAKRENDPKWLLEQQLIEGMLADLPGGVDGENQPRTVVLDCPVGTGRFLPFYVERGFYILGMDISRDMLSQAQAKIEPLMARAMGELRQGDIRATGLPDKSVDVAVNCRACRILHRLGHGEIRKTLREVDRAVLIRNAGHLANDGL